MQDRARHCGLSCGRSATSTPIRKPILSTFGEQPPYYPMLKNSVFSDEPKFAGTWARKSKKDLGGTLKLTLMQQATAVDGVRRH